MKTNTLSTSVPNSYYPGNSLPAGSLPHQLWQRLAFLLDNIIKPRPPVAFLGQLGTVHQPFTVLSLFLLSLHCPRLRCMTDAFVPTAILGENNPLTQS